MTALTVGFATLVLLTLAGSAAVVSRLDDGQAWGAHLRARFLFGVPWGTLVVVGLVIGAYLFVQDGITDPSSPVTIPFRAWSYLYPLGMGAASFTHAGESHLIGNVAGTLVVAPIAEYAWGHYASEESERLHSKPWVRALVLFPGVVLGAGLFTSLFGLGPVIGFSGVVFAFIGFAVIRYPLTTVLATAVVQSALLTTYRGLTQPLVVETAQASPPAPPGWAQVAIQGHAIGLFLGLLCGTAVAHRRGFRPNPTRLWVALVLIGFSKGLWAIYWFGGEETFILFRGPGVAVVFVLALVVTLALAASDRPIPSLVGDNDVNTKTDTWLSKNTHSTAVEFDPGTSQTKPDSSAATTRRSWKRFFDSDGELNRRETAAVVLVVLLALLSGPAVPANLFLVDETATGAETVTVEDYTIGYDEGVQNELVSIVDIWVFQEATTLTASGVIVTSSDRNVWHQAVSKDQLAFSGEETVTVGGVGWRESVTVTREGWEPIGNETVYQVWLEDSDTETVTFQSEPTTADLQLEGQSVTVDTNNDGDFVIRLADEQTPVPADGDSVEVGDLEFRHESDRLYATTGETNVTVATKERYN